VVDVVNCAVPDLRFDQALLDSSGGDGDVRPVNLGKKYDYPQ
jgi:hypothetical protein